MDRWDVLVTGVAGFIGNQTALTLLDRGVRVYGVDNLDPYYDVSLKQARLGRLSGYGGFGYDQMDLADRDATAALFRRISPRRVVHLAAQPGVRYSIENPHAYVDANLIGFVNVLEGCRQVETEHLVYASTSSVYGAGRRIPFSTDQVTDHPINLYAATKKANEAMAHAYSHLFGLPMTGLRFFTVYGPWGRPDMAVFSFARAILAGQPIRVFNNGDMRRDFTYVDDIAEAVCRVLDLIPAANPAWDALAPDPASSSAPARLYNIGASRSVDLLHMIHVLEQALGQPAVKDLQPMQPGDLHETYADTDALYDAIAFRPETPVEVGIPRFVDWYRGFYGI